MKIICIGRNYADHAKELDNPVPERPIIFMKPTTALLINDKPFYYPEFSSDIHFEAELVIKICKNGRHVSLAHAARYFDEVTVGLDLTARDIQSDLKRNGHPWEIAKGFDHSAVLGQFISTDGLDMSRLPFELSKNGDIVQQGLTTDMIFSFAEIISYCSQFFKLQVGDLIYTGTPAGVGPISIGDRFTGYIAGQAVMRCEIR